MKRLILTAAMALVAQCVQAQITEAPRVNTNYLGLGLTSMSAYYTGANESANDLLFAPTLLGSVGISRVMSLRGSIGYQRKQTDRDERSPAQRFVRHQTTSNVVVPVLLQFTLNPAATRFHTALTGGFTFWNINQHGQQTYYYSSPSQPASGVPQDLTQKRLDVFLTGGLSASYQLAPKWVALADLTLSGRLGGAKTQYYELLPNAGLAVGAGYRLGGKTK